MTSDVWKPWVTSRAEIVDALYEFSKLVIYGFYSRRRPDLLQNATSTATSTLPRALLALTWELGDSD